MKVNLHKVNLMRCDGAKKIRSACSCQFLCLEARRLTDAYVVCAERAGASRYRHPVRVADCLADPRRCDSIRLRLVPQYPAISPTVPIMQPLLLSFLLLPSLRPLCIVATCKCFPFSCTDRLAHSFRTQCRHLLLRGAGISRLACCQVPTSCAVDEVIRGSVNWFCSSHLLMRRSSPAHVFVVRPPQEYRRASLAPMLDEAAVESLLTPPFTLDSFDFLKVAPFHALFVLVSPAPVVHSLAMAPSPGRSCDQTATASWIIMPLCLYCHFFALFIRFWVVEASARYFLPKTKRQRR